MWKLSLISVFVLLFALQSHAKSIEIDTDEDDCVDGWLSMDVTVRVDSEQFTFNPSCDFSFRDDFKTSDDTSCHIEAGMCSSFSPQNKIEVSCDGGIAESVEVKCPAGR